MDIDELILVSVDDHVVEPPDTVGALRARATHVDLTPKSSERLRKTGDAIVSVMDLASNVPR